MSGVRFVRYMAELAGLPAGEALERAHERSLCGPWKVRYRKVSTYSLGMKQLIKLAQALAHDPSCLFWMSRQMASILLPSAHDSTH